MTAKEAIDLISPQVDLCYPQDKDQLFNILTLVNNKAWKEGSWWGMNKHFKVKVRKDHEGYYYFIAPNGYNVLQAVNVNTEPTLIKDEWFEFHQNALGSIREYGSNWSRNVVDMGEVPVINQPGDSARIAVRSLGPESDVIVNVLGDDQNGNRINSYVNKDGKSEMVLGSAIAVSTDIRVIDNIIWSRIESISKSVSMHRVEVYAMYPDGRIQILTRMEPEEKESRLRKYLVPENCGYSCVHGIFKESKPERIVNESQKMIIDDFEAIISLAMSMDYMFIKRTPESSLPYTVNGIKSLEDDNREHQSPSNSTIQVVGIQEDDDFRDFTY